MTTIANINAQAQDACLAWITDPGHSWLAVSLDNKNGFPEAANFASMYSYYDMTAAIIFLEEDCDAAEFIEKYGIDFKTIHIQEYENQDHFVRRLPRHPFATN